MTEDQTIRCYFLRSTRRGPGEAARSAQRTVLPLLLALLATLAERQAPCCVRLREAFKKQQRLV